MGSFFSGVTIPFPPVEGETNEWVFDAAIVSDTVKLETDPDYERGHLYVKTHDNGWTVSAEIQADYYTWISNLTAEHPEYGTVQMNGADQIFTASSMQAYDQFDSAFGKWFQQWDYQDI